MALSTLTTLKAFFGFNTARGDTTLQQFAAEVKDLTEEQKTELAGLAKAELIRTGKNKPEDFGF